MRIFSVWAGDLGGLGRGLEKERGVAGAESEFLGFSTVILISDGLNLKPENV